MSEFIVDKEFCDAIMDVTGYDGPRKDENYNALQLKIYEVYNIDYRVNSERDMDIFRKRLVDKRGTRSIGADYNLTASRIGQIEDKYKRIFKHRSTQDRIHAGLSLQELPDDINLLKSAIKYGFYDEDTCKYVISVASRITDIIPVPLLSNGTRKKSDASITLKNIEKEISAIVTDLFTDQPYYLYDVVNAIYKLYKLLILKIWYQRATFDMKFYDELKSIRNPFDLSLCELVDIDHTHLLSTDYTLYNHMEESLPELDNWHNNFSLTTDDICREMKFIKEYCNIGHSYRRVYGVKRHK